MLINDLLLLFLCKKFPLIRCDFHFDPLGWVSESNGGHEHTINWLGNRMLVFYLRLATAKHITDSHGGIRIYSPRLVKKLYLYGWHTYVQEFIVEAARLNFKIVELPSRWLERKHSESRVLKGLYKYILRTTPALAIHLHLHWFCFLGFILSLVLANIYFALLLGISSMVFIFYIFRKTATDVKLSKS